MIKELSIEIIGRVQGVNFRRRLAIVAQKLDISGKVWNTTLGSVKVIAQGTEEQLNELLSWCQTGFFPAKITGLSYCWCEINEKYTDFTIQRKQSLLPDQFQSFKNLSKSVLGINPPASIPRHVVIIPDGNRRWAREKGWHPWVGHRKAVQYERMQTLFKESKKLGIEYLSFWGFSTENWSRGKEVKYLFKLFKRGFKKLHKSLLEEKIRFRHFGRQDRLPADIIAKMRQLEEETKHFSQLNFQFCLDYNGRDELVRAFQTMIDNKVTNVTEEMISDHLDTSEVPDPDLIIRTSGEQRTSGVMAYQSVYAELYFTKVYFPDFDAEQFHRAILHYSARTRRFGGTNKADLVDINPAKLLDPELI